MSVEELVVLTFSQGQAYSCRLMFGTNRLYACTTLRRCLLSFCASVTLLSPSLF